MRTLYGPQFDFNGIFFIFAVKAIFLTSLKMPISGDVKCLHVFKNENYKFFRIKED